MGTVLNGNICVCMIGMSYFIGRKDKINGTDVLRDPFRYVEAGNQMALMYLPGKPKVISIDDARFMYEVNDQVLEDIFLEATTGVKPIRAPLANPEEASPNPQIAKSGNVRSFGNGPRKN